ncbi:MAG: 1-acyl-sn-glycerol-3-phosphate acyltransferase [Oscillospiraceae bacterium]|nr:1-acyl-sn-glycerol-3-phosphate acyltransferase [Oscillospiraceae bacterium]
MFYRICYAIVRFALLFVFRLKFVGRENLPKEGGAIVAFNHTSNWDPVVAGLSSGRKLRFMAKEELFENPVFGALISRLGAFPVHRGKGDIGAIKSSLKILSEGEVMLMFPEGHRIKDGRKVKAKPGIALIAQRAKVPVVPVCISGKYAWLHKITVTYGKPISLEEYYGKRLEQEKIQEIADGILDRVRALDTGGAKGITE